MKRSQGVDFDALLDSLHPDRDDKPEHEAWEDLDDEVDTLDDDETDDDDD